MSMFYFSIVADGQYTEKIEHYSRTGFPLYINLMFFNPCFPPSFVIYFRIAAQSNHHHTPKQHTTPHSTNFNMATRAVFLFTVCVLTTMVLVSSQQDIEDFRNPFLANLLRETRGRSSGNHSKLYMEGAKNCTTFFAVHKMF